MLEITGLSKIKSVQLITMGCSKNRVDSEKLLSRIKEGGLQILPEDADYKQSRPNAVIINTCGFIQDAKQESIDEILKAAKAKNDGYVQRLVVCGCLSERYRKELTTALPEVDAIFGSFEWDKVAAYLGLPSQSDSAKRLLTTPSHYAYLKIAEGCNRKCSYCAIPLIKGRFRSVPMTALVKEARNLAKQGVRELILIAQDTTYYGLDLYKKRALAQLIEKLSSVKGIEWIRIHYSYPAQFPKDVLKVMAENPKVCKYLDIPLQHCSTKVLKTMRRGVDFAKTQALIDDLRNTVKGVALRTTMMVGHPGEGKKEFEQLLNFIKKNRFEMLGAFTYSEEEGTFDAKNYPDTITPKEKKARYNALMKLQSTISLENNRKRVGWVEKVIIDEYKEGYLLARSQRESPEVDGQIIIDLTPQSNKPDFDARRLIGKFAAVRIISASSYDLTATLA